MRFVSLQCLLKPSSVQIFSAHNLKHTLRIYPPRVPDNTNSGVALFGDPWYAHIKLPVKGHLDYNTLSIDKVMH